MVNAVCGIKLFMYLPYSNKYSNGRPIVNLASPFVVLYVGDIYVRVQCSRKRNIDSHINVSAFVCIVHRASYAPCMTCVLFVH